MLAVLQPCNPWSLAILMLEALHLAAIWFAGATPTDEGVPTTWGGTLSHLRPAASSEQPAARSKQPAASGLQPAASSQQPASASLQGAGGRGEALRYSPHPVGVAGREEI